MRCLVVTVICVLATIAYTRPSPARHKRQYLPDYGQYPQNPGLGSPDVLPPIHQQLSPPIGPQPQEIIQQLLPPQYEPAQPFIDPSLFNPRGPGPIQPLTPLDQNVPWEPLYSGPPLGGIPYNSMPAPSIVGSRTAQRIMHMGAGPQIVSGRDPLAHREHVRLRTPPTTAMTVPVNRSDVAPAQINVNMPTAQTASTPIAGNSPRLSIGDVAGRRALNPLTNRRAPTYNSPNPYVRQPQVQQIPNPNQGPYQLGPGSRRGGPRMNAQGSYDIQRMVPRGPVAYATPPYTTPPYATPPGHTGPASRTGPIAYMRPPPPSNPRMEYVNPVAYTDPYAMDPYASTTYQDPYNYYYPGMDPYYNIPYEPPAPGSEYIGMCLFHNATEATPLTPVKFGPVEDNCAKYVLCNYTESEWGDLLLPEVLSCSFGFWFDQRVKACVDIDNTPVPCEWDPCKTNNSTFTLMEVYAGECNAFFECAGTLGVVEQCDPNQYFHPHRRQCLPNTLTSNCSGGVLTMPTTTERPIRPRPSYYGYPPPGRYPGPPPMAMPYLGSPYYNSMPYPGPFAQPGASPYDLGPPQRHSGPSRPLPPRRRPQQPPMPPYYGPPLVGGQPGPVYAPGPYGHPLGVYGQPAPGSYNPSRSYSQLPSASIPSTIYKRSYVQPSPTPTPTESAINVTANVTTIDPFLEPTRGRDVVPALAHAPTRAPARGL